MSSRSHHGFVPLIAPLIALALVLVAGLLHPMQLTSVLYAVQRMTSLSALFVFLGLIGYVYGRRQVQRGEPRGFVLMTVGIGAGSILGVLNKENAALLPLTSR